LTPTRRTRATALLALLLSSLLVFPAVAAPKRRAVAKPFIDASTPEGWLLLNARLLASAEQVPFWWDLEPLRGMVGDATIVGLGDGTHGTHEFYTVKLRVVEYLVREMGFEAVAFEAPFPLFNRLNTYVLGGAGDPRALLSEVSARFNYFFWKTEEILALVEWMREYNAHRGDRPPVEIAGADIYDQVTAWKDVVAYLRTVDPAAAAQAEREYACVGEQMLGTQCSTETTRVINVLAPREAELIGKSSARAFHDALQNARVVLQTQTLSHLARDANMAVNMLWMRDHRGTSGRVIYWAHNEHVTKGPSELGINQTPAGEHLEQALGSRYFAIATMTAAGSYTQWEQKRPEDPYLPVVKTFAALPDGAYETYFRLRSMPYLLIPLRGTLPDWLTGPARWNSAGVSSDPQKRPASLPEKFDAAIFVDTTTPTRLLP